MHVFPEDQYAPNPRFAAVYWERVTLGYQRAAMSRVAVCGLARDLGHGVGTITAALEQITAMFGDHLVFLYENDSSDGTAAALATWAMGDARRSCLSETYGRPRWRSVRSGARGDDMARYRNKYADAVRAINAGFDYVIVLDTDLAGWSLDGIASTIGLDHWDACGSNGLAVHRGAVVQYDAWAWRALEQPAPMEAHRVNSQVYDRGHPVVPLFSCFGGMAVYTAAAFTAGRYAGGDCEHVSFHASMAKAGYPRLFCNPGMITVYR